MATKIFGDIARFYDSVYMDKDYEGEARQITRLLDPTFRILDVGCGTGGHLTYFNRYFREAIGIDPSEEMISVARMNNLNVVKARIERREVYKLGKFDAVVSMFDVFDYIHEDEEYDFAVQNVNKILEMNGLFYVEGWNKDRIATHYEKTRYKIFKFMNKEGIRVSNTNNKNSLFKVEYHYFWNGYHYEETHRMRPRLREIPDLSRYGMTLTSVDSDEYSVKAWFRKFKELPKTITARPKTS